MSIKKVPVFHVTAVCQLYFGCNFGRSPRLRCCSRGVEAARCELCVVPLLTVTRAEVPLPVQQLTCHQGLCSQAMIWCQSVTSRGKKIPSVAACDRAERKAEQTATREAGEMTCISGDCLETSHFAELLQHVVLWTNSF